MQDNGKEVPERYGKGTPILPPDIPKEKRGLFYTASMAGIFSIMGSWKGEPHEPPGWQS